MGRKLVKLLPHLAYWLKATIREGSCRPQGSICLRGKNWIGKKMSCAEWWQAGCASQWDPEQRANSSSQQDSQFLSGFSIHHPETWTRGKNPGKSLCLEKGEQDTCLGGGLWSLHPWRGGPLSMMDSQSGGVPEVSGLEFCQSCSELGS